MNFKAIFLSVLCWFPPALLAADQNSDRNGQNQVRILERVETDFTRIGLVFSTCSSAASIFNVWAASGHDPHDAFGFNLLKNASDLGSKIIALVVLRQNESPNTIGRSLLSQLERQWGRKAIYCGMLSGVSSLISDTAYRFRGDDCSDLCTISAGVKNGSAGLALLSEGYALLTDFKRPHNDDERSAAGRRVYALVGLGFSVTSTTLSTIIDHAGITGKTPLTVLAYLRDSSSILALVSDFRATFKVTEFYQGRPGDMLLPESTEDINNKLIDWLRNIRDAALACHDQQNTRSNSHNRFEYLTLPFSMAVVGFELNHFDERGDPTRQKVTVLFGQISENEEEEKVDFRCHGSRLPVWGKKSSYGGSGGLFSFNRNDLNESDQHIQRINDGIKVALDINEEITYDRRALFSENDSIRTLLKKTNRGFQFPALIDGSKTFNCDLLIFAEPQIEVNEIRVER